MDDGPDMDSKTAVSLMIAVAVFVLLSSVTVATLVLQRVIKSRWKKKSLATIRSFSAHYHVHTIL